MAKVDSKGRIVLPQAVRERLGLSPGTEVDVREEDGRAVIEPEDRPEQIVRDLERLIAEASEHRTSVPPDEMDPLSKDHLDSIRRQAERADIDDDGSEDRNG